MGPRSFNRGNYVICQDSSIENLASMGPRSFNRGNVVALEVPRPSLSGFNGAAVFQPRKSDRRGRGLRLGLIASMGPRSFNRGNLTLQNIAQRIKVGFNGAAVFQPRKS